MEDAKTIIQLTREFNQVTTKLAMVNTVRSHLFTEITSFKDLLARCYSVELANIIEDLSAIYNTTGCMAIEMAQMKDVIEGQIYISRHR
ncbi:hypothetical protein [Listeria monocytogenes]|uniref:hypothetical protein n=1 Tax=Listeria monocytogenes TaxID=1639 RepID=UPI001E57DE1B|nr:hypothetical protein [Listeria monocytogenes]MCD2223039.1 hypothetical protein [Listeria monocytogenes]